MEPLLAAELLAVFFLFACFATAVAVRGEGARARVSLAVILGGVPVGIAAVLLAGAAFLRFTGLRDSAFVLAALLFGATVAVLAGVMRRGFRPRLPEGTACALGWPLGRLAIATGAGGAVVVATFLMARSAALEELRLAGLEGERIRQEVLGQAPPNEENAADLYLQAIETLLKEEEALDVVEDAFYRLNPDDDWAYDADEEEPPAKDVLNEALTRLDPTLVLVREAVERPRCRFAPQADAMPVAPISELISLARVLLVAQWVDLEGGRLDAAATNLNALFALADHITDEATAIHHLCSTFVRSLGTDGLERFLVAPGLQVRHLDALELGNAGAAVERLPEILLLEEGFGLRSMGTLALGGELFLPSLGDLYLVFYLADDVTGYRALMTEFREACQLSPRELLRIPELEAERVLANGVLTAALCPFFDDQAKNAVSADSRDLMVRAAIAATRFRLREDRFPRTAQEWESVGVDALPTNPFTGEVVEVRETEGTWELVCGTDDPEHPLRVTLRP